MQRQQQPQTQTQALRLARQPRTAGMGCICEHQPMQRQWMVQSLQRLNPALTGREGLVQQQAWGWTPATASLTAQRIVLAMMD